MTPLNTLLFLTVLTLTACQILDYRLINQSPQAETVKDCTTAGIFCETCRSRVICIETNNNTFTKEPLETCETPYKCVKNACVTDFDPICDDVVNLEFPCQTIGVFPDPFDCHKYVMCIKNEENKFKVYPYQCEDGYGFNIANDLCDIKLKSNKCTTDYPVPICKNISDHAGFKAKPAMYYICEKYSPENNVLYPKLNLCPGGTTFNEFKCVSK